MSVRAVAVQSLRQVLLELQRPSHQQLTCNTSKSSTSKPFRVVTFPSCSSNSTINTTSPAPKPDSENTHSSPWARVVPFWGPGLAPRGSAETDTDCQPASYSVLIRLQQLCSGHRNLRATATEAEASSSSSSSNPGSSSSSGSQLWSFDVNVPDTVITSMFYKRLYWRLGAHSAKQSLIAEALQASSTGSASLPSCVYCCCWSFCDPPFLIYQECRLVTLLAQELESIYTHSSSVLDILHERFQEQGNVVAFDMPEL